MEMTPKAGMLLLMGVAGLFVILVGMMGMVTADCPRPIVWFPEARWHCTAFSGAAALGTLMTLVGMIGGPMVALYADMRKHRKSGADIL